MTACPGCGRSASKVIFLGLPMRLCDDPVCSTLFGRWSRVAAWLPVPTRDAYGWFFMFTVYEGAYLPALWRWLTDWS